MRVWAGLFVAAGLAALTGCRAFERWSKDRNERPLFGEPTSRTRDADRDNSRPPKNWLDAPVAPAAGTPAVNSDVRGEVRGLLAGQVVDPDGNGVAYLAIQIDVTDPAQNGGVPVTAETDKSGYFLIRGLRPNQSYTLTATTKQGGRALAGQSVARTPSPNVRLQLRDDIALPPAKNGPDLPPAGAALPGGPPSLFDTPASRPAPGASTAPTPIPLSKDGGNLHFPAETPPTDGAFSPVPPAGVKPTIPTPRPPSSPRPDLVAPGPPPINKPPVANIPNPSAPPKDGDLLPPPTTSKYRGKAVGEFSLVDSLGRPRTFGAGRADELVLLDFMTTTCGPCKKAVPALKELQANFVSKGLEVVGVACDDVDEAARRAGAGKYADDFRLNYLVYAEPGPSPGRVMNRFGVTVFPTLVLIDGTGTVLWQGRAAEIRDLERVIRGR